MSAEPGASTSGQTRARRGLGSFRSMIISTVLVVLAVLAWWAFVPRTNQSTQPVADVAGIAREIGLAKHWDPAVADGLPKGWQPVNVLLVTASGQPDTWQAGYDAPGGKYARVLQTKNGSTSWVQTQTSTTGTAGSVVLDGVKWSKAERASGGERSLIRSAPLGGLSTVVTGTGDWAQLEQFAKSLKPLSHSQLAPQGPQPTN